MAEMSDLAYRKFEVAPQSVLDGAVDALAGIKIETHDERVAAFRKLLTEYGNEVTTAGEEKERLKQKLGTAGFELLETFSKEDTQAFLAVRRTDKVAVLAFRGTETTSPADIKTDLRLGFRVSGRGHVHEGFDSAFAVVKEDIAEALNDLESTTAGQGSAPYKVYITGHSLGGALAVLAATAFGRDSIAACYTFGSPKVGDGQFGDDIKIPLYRVVNAADIVPRLPPTWITELLILIAGALPVPYARRGLRRVLAQFRGYRHHGDMRYLTATVEQKFVDVRLISNPGLPDRVRWFLTRVAGKWKAGVQDHNIEIYAGKLRAWATRADAATVKATPHVVAPIPDETGDGT